MVATTWYIGFIICLVLAGFVCADTPEDTISAIALERGMCYGYCPVYTLTIFQNGTVLYNGEQYVKETGERNGTINATAYDELMKLAEQSGFFTMHDAYRTVSITDMPSAIVTITNGTFSKRVEHYHGDDQAPRELTVLEDAIDGAANASQWISPYEPDIQEGRAI